MLLTLDFETYYDTNVTLTKLTTMEYVKHPQFKVWGVGLKVNDEPAEWFSADETEEALNAIDWDNVTLLCHNTLFDGYILAQYYKLKPKYYLDTAAMARGMFPGMPASLKETSIRLFPNDASMRKGEDLVKAKGHVDLPPDRFRGLDHPEPRQVTRTDRLGDHGKQPRDDGLTGDYAGKRRQRDRR